MGAATLRAPIGDPWTTVDPLGNALRILRMSGVFYCRSEFTAPWGLALPAVAAEAQALEAGGADLENLIWRRHR